MQTKSLNDLIQLLYLVSSGLEDTDTFLCKMSDHFRSNVVCGIAMNKYLGELKSPTYIGMSDRDIFEFQTYYSDKNILVQAALPDMITGKVVDASHYVSRSDLVSSEYYNDFLCRVEAEHNLGFMTELSPEWFYILFISRRYSQGEYTAAELQNAQLIMPHFEAATRIQNHIIDLKADRDYSGQALDHSNKAVCFVGDNLKILHANRAAKRVLRDSEILISEKGSLSAGLKATSKLRVLLSKISAGTMSGSRHIRLESFGEVMGASLMVFEVQDADEFIWLDLRKTKYIMFLDTKPTTTRECEQFLTDQYGISKREIELINHIVHGRSPKQASALMLVSVSTARSHLKSIFGKMGVHTQTQLAMKVSRLNSVC